MKRVDVPILIVGAGPVGLSTALLLARQGLSCHVIEQRAGLQSVPAAHAVNPRTLEIFRQLGIDAGAIRRAAQNPADAGFVYWVPLLGGEVIGRLAYERQGDDALAVTPTPMRNLSQHRLEPILVDALRRADGASLEYAREWQSARQENGRVISEVRDLDGGDVCEIHSRYLLAADGAGSPVRKWLGIQALGPQHIQSFVMIHFEADLRPLVRDCPGVLYWICGVRGGAALVAHDIDREWVYMHPWEPDRESRDDYDPARCEGIVRRALARPDVELTIRTISTWTMTAQVAERYRDDRVFLLGDSAHRFPPTGGLGLNTGVQDAHNLAWKLAAVEHGWAPASLLDTYEVERRPVAQHNADQSLANAMRLFEVFQALEIDDDPAASQARMNAVLADAAGRQRVAAAIAHQAEHFDMLGLQLGFRYDAGALVPDPSATPPTPTSVSEFIPCSYPGARLPHGWVSHAGRRVSTLDLIAPDRFTLLAGPDGSAWVEAACSAGAPLQAFQIGRDVSDAEAWWTSLLELPPDGALLVRPDQHIAFRAGPTADAAAALQRALAVTLTAA